MASGIGQPYPKIASIDRSRCSPAGTSFPARVGTLHLPAAAGSIETLSEFRSLLDSQVFGRPNVSLKLRDRLGHASQQSLQGGTWFDGLRLPAQLGLVEPGFDAGDFIQGGHEFR